MSLTPATQNIAKAIYYERYPEGAWGFLTPEEKSAYYDQAQAAEQALHHTKPSVQRHGANPQTSIATKRITVRLKLDWLKKAATNSAHMSYSDPALEEATRVLETAAPLIAELLDDSDVNGPADLGREFVRRYTALRSLNRRRTRR